MILSPASIMLVGVFIGKNRSPQLISIARRDSFNFYEEEAQQNHQDTFEA